MKKSFVSLVVPMVVIMALIAAYIIPSMALAGTKFRENVASLIEGARIKVTYFPDGPDSPSRDDFFCIQEQIVSGNGSSDVYGKVIVSMEGDTPTSVKIDLKGPEGLSIPMPESGKYPGTMSFVYGSLPDVLPDVYKDCLYGLSCECQLTVGRTSKSGETRVRITAVGTP